MQLIWGLTIKCNTSNTHGSWFNHTKDRKALEINVWRIKSIQVLGDLFRPQFQWFAVSAWPCPPLDPCLWTSWAVKGATAYRPRSALPSNTLPAARCRRVILCPSFYTMKHLKTLVPLLWANEGFPQKVNEIPESTLELATICKNLPNTFQVLWTINRERQLGNR